jgi:hypothetical protein
MILLERKKKDFNFPKNFIIFSLQKIFCNLFN